MKLNKLLASVFVVGACASLPLLSSMAQAQEERAYDASIALGYVGTSGNTETSTFNTEALLTYRTVSWTHNLKFQALGSSQDGSTNAERYYLEDKSDYSLDDENSYLFVKGSYLDDRFSGFDSQSAISAGYGRYFFRDEGFNLQGYAGLGYRKNKVINQESIGEGIISLGEDLAWDISETAKLVQSFNTEIGEDITITKFELGIETNIIGNIVTKAAVAARHTSEVPVGREKTDTLTSISLVYTF